MAKKPTFAFYKPSQHAVGLLTLFVLIAIGLDL